MPQPRRRNRRPSAQARLTTAERNARWLANARVWETDEFESKKVVWRGKRCWRHRRKSDDRVTHTNVSDPKIVFGEKHHG